MSWTNVKSELGGGWLDEADKSKEQGGGVWSDVADESEGGGGDVVDESEEWGVVLQDHWVCVRCIVSDRAE